MQDKQVFITRSYDFASYFYGNGHHGFWYSQFYGLKEFINEHLRSDFLKNLKKEVVLDVGCGNGFSSKIFKELYPEVKKIVGIDISKKMLERAVKELGKLFIPVYGDITDDNLWSSINTEFDGILSFFVLHWIDNSLLESVVSNIYNKLKQSGWFIGAIFGKYELFPEFLSIIRDVIEIYGEIDNFEHILSIWNTENSSILEKCLINANFKNIRLSSTITSKEYTVDEVVNIVFYRFGFWTQSIPVRSHSSAKQRLSEFLKEDLKPNKGYITLREHILTWESQK